MLWLSLSLALAGPAAEQQEDPYYERGETWLQQAQQQRPIKGKARGVVLVVGDGMGVSTLTAARILQGQLQGNTGEEGFLAWEQFSDVALVKTYSADAQVSDSSATATALMTGIKTNYSTLGVAPSVGLGDCAAQQQHAPLRTLAEWAHEAGRATGFVTTTRVTHATPGATYAHSSHRDWESDADKPAGTEACPDIAQQLIDSSIDVALGGGKARFLPVEQGGRRSDGKDLLASWTQAGNLVVTDRAGLQAAGPGRLLGTFADSHLPWVEDRTEADVTLPELVTAALDRLEADSDGYFLLVEGGRIDHGHHDGQPRRALMETVELSDTVAMLAERLDPRRDLLLVTADHSHVFTIAGYPERGNDILGPVRTGGTPEDPNDGERELASDNLPYPTLGYTNGPGAVHGRSMPVPDHLETADMPATLVYHQWETHGGEDVAVHARGPWAWLLGGTMEQSDLFHLMRHAMGLKD